MHGGNEKAQSRSVQGSPPPYIMEMNTVQADTGLLCPIHMAIHVVCLP